MPKTSLNQVETNYLREIYRAIERSSEVTTGWLAKTFNVRPASAVDVLNRLRNKRLVEKQGWGRIRLTRQGTILASQIIHNHRVLELYFNQGFGIPAEDACKEASKIDYLLGEIVIRKICEKLRFPDRCIHGLEVRHDSCGGR